MADEDVKPKIEEDQPITITVKEADGNTMMFKCKPRTKFEKVFKAYCAKKGLAENSVRFMFEGTRLKAEETPDSVAMEDGSQIDVMLEQLGGC